MNLVGVELQMLRRPQVLTGIAVMKELFPGEDWVRSQCVCVHACQREFLCMCIAPITLCVTTRKWY